MHNCGWPPHRMTERAVELALADRWLDQVASESIMEIGAVTPYYWPRRIHAVMDPYDIHPLVSRRDSMFNVDFRGRDVLAISTIEHVGFGDCGPVIDGETSANALLKIIHEARRLLITIPYGFNPSVDDLWRSDTWCADVQKRYLVRSARGNDWVQVQSVDEVRRPYGDRHQPDRAGANGLVVLERGGLL